MSIKKYEVKYNNGQTVVHWDGVFQRGDMSLCGSNLIGDSWDGKEGWQAGIEANKNVTCVQCKRIIDHVKNITHSSNKQ